ncbi:hypothetical protein [Streptomyces sp. NBC_00096]|uniref:hypothetical protein n=1 Tax=Streptomyces sp. NBC_00096 TaxID=2975650 RepID=UPI00324C2C28
MQFKRIAAVAAAAVVGPTVLMTTPAMADEQQQPAVSVPDAAPKDDAAPAADPTPATTPTTTPQTGPTPGTGPVTPPVTPPVTQPVTPPVTQPGTPATGPATTPPAPVTPAPAPAAEKPAEAKDTPGDSILMGPDVTIAGIPKAGFKADGSWTALTVEVDNSANTEVTDYTPRITFTQEQGKLKPGQIKVERLVTDAAGNKSWKPADFIGGYNSNYFTYGLGKKASVARESVYTIDVRISFAADTPVVPFKLDSDGLSIRPDGGNAWSGATWYETSIAGAIAYPDTVEGPSLSLTGVSTEGYKAGGDWREVGIHVDNTGKPALKKFGMALAVERLDFSQLQPEHIQVEAYGHNGWQAVKHSYSDTGLVFFDLGLGPISSGETTDVKLRIRFTKDAPLGDIRLRPAGGAEDDLGSGDHHVWVVSPAKARLTKVLAADPATGGTGNQGNDPAPNGGSKPIDGTGTGNRPGGQLAETGSSPASTWALGTGGVALTLGAALVAGTGRHRRRTTA